MKVFISGPMSGMPYENRAAFYKAEEELEKHGYSVWNPAWLAYPSDTEFSKDVIHAIDNEALRHCDAIYMLKGWRYSEGARAEYETAKKRGLLTMYESDCCFDRVTKPIDDCFSMYDYIGPNKIDSLEKRVDSFSKWRDNLAVGYIKWSSEVSQFDERIEKLEENMKEIAANGGLGLSFNLMNERVSSNKRDISSIKNDIATIKDNIDNQRCTLDVISERVDKHYKKHNDNDDALEKRIKDMNERMSLFGRELDAYEEAYKQLRTSLDNNDNALERRIKAIEKRLSIKPFYAPTEDEKDDD